MKKSKTICYSTSFTSVDFSHCLNCMQFVDFLLDDCTDGLPGSVRRADLHYLEKLLLREYNIMCEVLEVSGGNDDVV